MSEILTTEKFRECIEDLASDRWGDSELFAHDAALRLALAAAERERDEWALRAQQAAMDRDEQALRADAAESRAARLEETVRRIESACGLPDPAEACRVVLAIAAEREERGKEKGNG